MGLLSKIFGEDSKSSAVTTTQQETVTVSKPVSVMETEGVTVASVDGPVTITDPQSVAAARDISLRSLDVVAKGTGDVLDLGGDIFGKSLGFLENVRTGEEKLVQQIQKASLETQAQIAEATRQETTKTFENISKFVIVGLVLLGGAYFATRRA
ncbi:MAG: hypothetical protein A3G34_15195 [Candidatus Lindowbacteria bacterium RIFCSPLOWO2_12_FULL_62_27]|nr:MAG: hypothetical protein A3G34_15195 [Candidatus Lindowbacteria bacterium RIFCSPLOWO2_12_FULL_62_27]OGH63870.1 MAG: hypothetical protein A3I06_06175 [Candidatus Lindowbacteria bacterium RIFCSPLOWO2_02_FULL_62_12]